MKICPKCNTIHEKHGIFCSRKCANSKTHSAETKEKIRNSVKRSVDLISKEIKSDRSKRGWLTNPKKIAGPYTPISFRKCNYCGSEFTSPFNRSWCTDHCFLEIKRKNWQGNKQRYKNISYDSSWEVDLAKWFEEQNIEFNPKPNSIKWVDKSGKEHKYFPDFYLPKYNVYIDPKNKIVISQQKEKLDFISSKVVLLYGDLNYLKDEILKLN